MKVKKASFLGRGWAFPPSFEQRSASVQMSADEQDIDESLQILLGTRPGERVMQPRFGCNLDVMLFEPLSTTLITYVKELVKTAILYHEPRVKVNDIQINNQMVTEGVILIEVEYTILSFNSRFNLVYPFYLEEGTDVNLPLRISNQSPNTSRN